MRRAPRLARPTQPPSLRTLPRRLYSDRNRMPTENQAASYVKDVYNVIARSAADVWSLRHWTRRANPVEWQLHTFDNPKELEKWTEYSDKDVGGKTRARLLFDPAGRAVFEGHLNIEIPKGARLVRSGYAAVMSPDQNYDLEDFDALEVMAKGDGRMYIVNLKPDIVGMPHLLFQHAIRTEPNWKKYVLPLKDFMLVVRGFEGERAQEVTPERIQSIGFLMAERRNGPFRLEVEYIKAINTNYTAARVYKKSFLRNMDEEEGMFDLEDPTTHKQEKK